MKTHKGNEELECFEYFGLRSNPFPVVPDVDNFYVCERIDRIVTEIVHGIVTRKGFLVLTGEIGLGKTTISRRVMRILEEEGVNTSLVFHSVCQQAELLREINQDFGIRSDSLVLGDQMKSLKEFLLSEHEKGKNTAILIDDAQNLDYESLELIRTISNLETDHEKLVQILLVGQPELADKLNSSRLRQLKSRIMISQEVHPLGMEELMGYVMFKLYMAGNTGTISVPKRAIRKVHALTGGNFRRVNRLMERCLYVAFLGRTTRIDRGVVCAAQRDLSPLSSRLFGRRFAWGVAVTVLLYVTGWMVFPDGYFWFFERGSGIQKEVSAGDDSLGQGDSILAEARIVDGASGFRLENHKAQGEVAKRQTAPEAIVDFLSSYGLTEFGAAFFEGLRNSTLDSVSGLIHRETGYQMIELNRVPSDVRSAYSLLQVSAEDTKEDVYILFWKPELQVDNFYLNYRGDEIRQLEARLLSLGLYEYKLDGLVGPRVMTALNRFQRENGLPVTGFPDSETIFLLCHASNEDIYE